MPPSFETSMMLNEPLLIKKVTPLVPVIDISPSRRLLNGKGKNLVKRRTYDEEPLPFKPSEKALRNARITARVAKPVPKYTLQIGEEQIDEVGVEEVLDYVSAFELEQFENRQFEEEREALAIALAAAEAEEERKRERRAERARQKGVIVFQESNDDDDSEVETGRHGRARPKYTQFFEKPRQRRRRRKRDPITGELMDRSEDESEVAVPTASADSAKRRRRKRHPITGELMPLSDREDEDTEMDSSAPGAPGLSSRATPSAFGVSRPKTTSPALELPKRRRRKRDPITGELLPLNPVVARNATRAEHSSDVDGEEDMRPDSIATTGISSRTASSAFEAKPQIDGQAMEPPKRRRRRRDTLTGELLPLESAAVIAATPPVEYASDIDHRKKPRRRRHPVTGEMMPLGYRYDANTGKMYQKSRDSMSPAMRKMSISQEHSAKRVKMASESSEDDLSQGRPLSSSSNQISLLGTSTRKLNKQSGEPKISEIDDLAEDDDQNFPMLAAKSRSTPKTSILHPNAARSLQILSSEPSPEPITLQSFLKSSARHDMDSDEDLESSEAPVKKTLSPTQTKTSIMNPVASRDADAMSQDVELDDDEWFVEAIIGHRMSDPKSHVGLKPTMLYHTKWEGSDELTWEPVDSFDPSTIADYRKRVGLNKKPTPSSQERTMPLRQSPAKQKASIKDYFASKSPLKPAVSSESEDEESEDDEDEGYAVEKILAHHMSDPRTHPGKPQTMLYRVKWIGWDEPTWEPIDSFPDKALVNDYRRKAGLPRV